MKALPSPQQLRYLLTLAETAHAGRAAEACGVTQSTLSAGISALERQLGVPILDRTSGKRIVFTATGQDLLAHGQRALTALESFTAAAEAARAPMSGPLRLGVIPTIGPFLLPRLVPAIRQTFPELRLFLREDMTDRLVERLLAGKLDLLFLAFPCEDCAGLERVEISRDELMVALPEGHPLARLDRVPAARLAEERLLLMEGGHCLRAHAIAACEAAVDPQEGFAATSLHTLAQMVAGGLGVALLPRVALDGGVAAGTGLVTRPLAGGGGWRGIGLAWRRQSPEAERFRALVPLIQGALPGA